MVHDVYVLRNKYCSASDSKLLPPAVQYAVYLDHIPILLGLLLKLGLVLWIISLSQQEDKSAHYHRKSDSVL